MSNNINAFDFGSHIVKIDANPNEADLAIVSIDSKGSPGELNGLVLAEYGYTIKNLPKADSLTRGTSSIMSNDRKPILFVVTVNGKNVKENLAKNLSYTLVNYRDILFGKQVWIPLMGTGKGGLSYDESYKTTVQTIKTFQKELTNESLRPRFIVGIPNSQNGVRLFEKLSLMHFKASEKKDNEAEEFVKSLNVKFYFEFYSLNPDSLDYINEEPWKQSKQNLRSRYKINNLSSGDVIIRIEQDFTLKRRTFSIDKIGLLTVSDVPEESFVNWVFDDLKIKYSPPSDSNAPFSQASVDDVSKILVHLPKSEWEKLRQQNYRNTDAQSKIPGIISDSEKGEDYLEINKDVDAFARVLAAKKFEPPLAVGLFGKWGSGKSFFMRKLMNRITDLSKNNIGNTFCKGVVQIHFNAWSYVDTNLWAGLISRIFEGLHEYISNNSLSDEAKKEIVKKLSERLNISKEEVGILKQRESIINNQLQELEKKRHEKKVELKNNLKSIKTASAINAIKEVDKEFKVVEKIEKAVNDNETFVKTIEELKTIVPESIWKNPQETYNRIVSAKTFIREFFKLKNIKLNVIFVSFVLLAIIFTPFFLKYANLWISDFNFTIPQIGLAGLTLFFTFWQRAEIVYKKIRPFASAIWEIKEDYKAQLEEALQKYNQFEKATQLRIKKGQEELLQINEQIVKTQISLTELEYKLLHATSTTTLYSFIEKRTSSDDYRKHLGIISIIRKDFEVLSGLFTEHKQEFERNEDSQEFKKYFNQPLERIILYIDDLDRCSADNVVSVLEAINLLMAYPLFTVVVGVDPRWIHNSLKGKYDKQLGKNVEQADTSDYLEKIFQIPFHLKEPGKISSNYMIEQLVRPSVSKELPDISENEIETLTTDLPKYGLKKSGSIMDLGQPISLSDLTKKNIENVPVNNPVIEFNTTEVNIIKEFGAIVSNTPRAIKRFVNVFRVIKIHGDLQIGSYIQTEELLAVLLMVVLPISEYRVLAPQFRKFLLPGDFSTISAFLQKNKEDSPNEAILRARLLNIISDNPVLKPVLMANSKLCKKHYDFISRFSF